MRTETMRSWEKFVFECLVRSLQANDEKSFDKVFNLALENQEVARLVFQAILYNYDQRRSTINV
jgi:hypothetical protein